MVNEAVQKYVYLYARCTFTHRSVVDKLRVEHIDIMAALFDSDEDEILVQCSQKLEYLDSLHIENVSITIIYVDSRDKSLNLSSVCILCKFLV